MADTLRKIAAWMTRVDLQRMVKSLSNVWNAPEVDGNPMLFMDKGGRGHIQRLLQQGYTTNDISTALRQVTNDRYGLRDTGEVIPASALPGGGGRKVAPSP